MSLLAIAVALATQSPVSLVYQPEVGSSYKSLTTIEQSGPMGDTTMSMTTLVKVLSFDDGYYKLQSTISNAKVTGGQGDNSATAKAMEKQSTAFVDKHFKFKIETKGDPNKDMLNALNQTFSSIVFPTEPINVGDTWKNSIDMGTMMKAFIPDASVKADGKLGMTFKLLKTDEKSITIETTIGGTVNMQVPSGAGGEAPTISMKFSGGGTSTMERATGNPINSETKINMDMDVAGQAITMKQSITIKRL